MGLVNSTHGCFTSAFQSRCSRKRPSASFVQAITAIVPTTDGIIDIGAGSGGVVYSLRLSGFNIVGIDGSEGVEKLSGGLVKQVDLVSSDCRELFGMFDWGLFMEVGEHIPKEYEGDVVRKVASIPRKGLIISWSSWNTFYPGHVNLRDESYVVGLFQQHDWSLDEESTAKFREAVGRRMRKRRSPFIMRKDNGI